jgi:hypothetical protein
MCAPISLGSDSILCYQIFVLKIVDSELQTRNLSGVAPQNVLSRYDSWCATGKISLDEHFGNKHARPATQWPSLSAMSARRLTICIPQEYNFGASAGSLAPSVPKANTHTQRQNKKLLQRFRLVSFSSPWPLVH